jgi:hypothetical protein
MTLRKVLFIIVHLRETIEKKRKINEGFTKNDKKKEDNYENSL